MKTLEETAFAETEERGSRFLCEIVPYTQFEERLAALRQLHPKANHHVTAIRYLQDNMVVERGRDDGEPAGTSGMPALRALQGADVINVGAIVTRYFGGTKLGTGGLARAYAAAVNAGLKEAKLIDYVKFGTIEITSTFANSEKVERFIAQNTVQSVTRRYIESGVVFEIEAPENLIEILEETFKSDI